MKCTPLFFLLASNSIFAQTTNSFTQIPSSDITSALSESKNVQPEVLFSPNDVITYYNTRALFNEACTGTLTLEDFAGGPSDTTTATGCAGPISSLGNNCFPPGEIQEGIIISSSSFPEDSTVFSPAAFSPDTADAIGPGPLEAFLDVSFPDGSVNSVGLTYSWVFADSVTIVIFGASGPIDTVAVGGLPGAGAFFFGLISSVPIVSLEFQSSRFEFVGNIQFGSCDIVSTENLDSYEFKLYPNPVDDRLTLDASENITSLSVFNTLGQQVKYFTPLTTKADLDISDLDSGIYFIKVQIKDKMGMYKIVKK